MMNAGKIEVTFEGLCPFFTKHISDNRLMVGVQGVFGAGLIKHTPKLTITEEDVSETIVYKTKFGRNGLSGEAFFHLFSEEGIVADDLSLAEDLKLLDVETELYPEEELGIDAGKCQVRLHFKNGVLSPVQATTIRFFDLAEDELITEIPQESYTYSAKLEIEIPERGFAVLHFDGEADDFVFKAGRNYIIAIESLPLQENVEGTEEHHQHIEINHFQYFYQLASHRPDRIIVPKRVIGPPPSGGTPDCMIGGFSKTAYPKG